MNFTSYEFILLTGLILVVYYCVPKRFQWMFLLAASYGMYASAGWMCLVYISITTFSTYLAAVKISKLSGQKADYLKEHRNGMDKEARKAYKDSIKRKQKVWLWIALAVDIGLFVVLKYSNFFIGNINALCSGLEQWKIIPYTEFLVPLGISFYTFQSMGYLLDVYNEKENAQKNYAKLALFVGFFPQLSQGPISRYEDLSRSLYCGHEWNAETVCFGLQRILWGYFKKLVIADRISIGLKTILAAPEQYQGIYFGVAMIFYAVQLYADFTGGIDIAVGIAQAMGITLKENFMRPFFSKSIKEYWNRWHISMGSWFKDYLFYPLSVSKTMLRISKKSRKLLGEEAGKRVPVYLTTSIVWFCTGIWHGASWNFVVWGLANCAVLLVSRELTPVYRWCHQHFSLEKKKWYPVFCVCRTVVLMSALRMFDCYRDVRIPVRLFFGMFTENNFSELWNGGLLRLGLSMADYIILLCGAVLMLSVSLVQRKQPVRKTVSELPYPVRTALWLLLFTAVLLLGAYGQGYEESQFIYNQF
ncbi:MAG: MBOAT family protein [Lachnospiraceae bacterium]|nr:MBOAT family protein [Lachnospiraceae bacterium]